MKFEITILGSNSAQPTPMRFSSAQVVNFREKLFLLDCGEGTQIQLRRYKQKVTRLNHIFITHLHGDHMLGLPGLISSLNLMGRRSTLHIYAHKDLEGLITPLLDYVMHKPMFKTEYHTYDPTKHALIYEDKSLEIYTIPLRHRTPTAGFLFKEKSNEYNIKKEMIDAYELSIKDILNVKKGNDHITPEGDVIPNSRLAHPPQKARTYAYITDTAYQPNIVPWLKHTTTLYHEATFADEETLRMTKTLHSSAGQAAQIAKDAEVGQLLIGHFSSRYKDVSVVEQAAKAVFPNTIAIKDGMTITL